MTIIISVVLLMAALCPAPALAAQSKETARTAHAALAAQAAQNPQFSIDMDNRNLQTGVSAIFVVSIANARGAEIVRVEGLEDFDLLSQSQSTSTTIGTGGSSQQVDNYYTIMPKSTGRFTLKAIILYGGAYYETNALEVTVGAGAAAEESSAQDLYVETVVSHDESFLGEKVVLTYELYTRYNIESFGFTDYTGIDGVMAKETPQERLGSELVYIDGVQYAKYEAKQLVIDPIRPGLYTIPSFNLQVNVMTGGSGQGGIFGGMFSHSEPVYLQTETKRLNVKPLPETGKPPGFSGIVGQLELSGDYSREEVEYGDSLTLLVEASGACNLDGFKSVFAGQLPGFTVYETQKNTEEYVENNRYRARKGFEVILVPEKPGLLEAPPVSVPYFNPETGKYESAEIPGASINVLGEISPQGPGGGETGVVETVRVSQVSYSEENGEYFTVRLKKMALIWILAGIAVVVFLVVLFLRIAANRKKQDRTMEVLYKSCMAAKEVEEVFSLLNDMMKHRYGLSLKASPKSAIKSRLEGEGAVSRGSRSHGSDGHSDHSAGAANDGLASKVIDIMEYMESSKAREPDSAHGLKEKIKQLRLISPSGR